jgi:hypothetical protein
MRSVYLFAATLAIAAGLAGMAVFHGTQVVSSDSAPTPTPVALDPHAQHATQVDAANLIQAPAHTYDLAPQLASQDKAMVMVRRANGAYEKYLLPPQQLDTFVHRLGAGNRVITTAPPESSVDASPPVPGRASVTFQASPGGNSQPPLAVPTPQT